MMAGDKSKSRLSTTLTTQNIPEDLMMRLVGTAERDKAGISAVVRMCLDQGLPSLRDIRGHYDQAIKKHAQVAA